MSEQPRISYSGGKGKLRHNNRDIVSSNVDPNRVKDNITFISLPLRVAYDKIFKEAQEEYDAKQKRNDRKIHDYFDKLFGDQPHADDLIVQNNNKQKSFYEYVVGIGDKDTMGYETNPEGAAIAEKILQEYAEGFQKRNPNFFVFNSVMHRDEATPHLHFDYIPYTDNCKKGMRRQQGIARALEEMGYGVGDHASVRFVQAERKVFREICERYGITPAEEKESRGYTFTVEEYKKHQDKIAEYEEKEFELEQKNADVEAKTTKAEKKLKEIKTQYDVNAEELRDVLNKKARASEIKLSIFDRETQTYHKNMLEQTRAIGNEAYKKLTEANDKIQEAAYMQAKTDAKENELLKLKKELENWENRLNAKDAELKKQQNEIEKKIETTAQKLLEEKLNEMFGAVRSTREKRFETFGQRFKTSDGKTFTEKFLEEEASLIKKIGEKEYNNLGLNRSEYTCYYFPSPSKMNYVISQLDKEQIPYIENDLGFEIENKYIEIVHSLEDSYKETYDKNYETLKIAIDQLSLTSTDLNNLYEKLEINDYKIKKDGYAAVCPKGSEIFIRLDSLGPAYSELALKNRIAGNQNFEKKYTETLEKISENNRLEYSTVKSIVFLMTAVKTQRYHFNKKHSNGVVVWVNNAELDKLTLLNKKINEGATIESLKQNFSDADEAVKKLENSLNKEKNSLDYFTELKEKIEVVFEGKPAPESKIQEYKKELNSFEDFKITANNYTRIYNVIADQEKSINEIEKNLKEKRNLLEETAEYYSLAKKVMDGTYVQSLCYDDKKQEEHRYIPHRSHGGMSR